MQDKPYMLYKDAKKFLSDKGIDFNENEITIATEYTGKKAIGVKKGYALHALESNEVLDEFIGKRLGIYV
ncbi:MAG: hypothetical protein DRR42_07910 [Gammaproteobacteria bacterium]|nr:MAG: hypothetical protein DRR42_07910 [Gammaproteobacteria bacterium]